MKINSVLGLVIAVLAGGCLVMGRQVWLDRQSSPETPAVRSQVQEQASPPPDSSRHFTASDINASGEGTSPAPDPARAGSATGYRGALARLPSWLPVPEEKKALLEQLSAVQNTHRMYAVDIRNGMTRARIEELVREGDEERRQAALHIERLLGPAVYPLWVEYQDTLRARNLLSGVDRTAETIPEDKIRTMAAAMTRAARSIEAELQASPGYRPQYLAATTSADIDTWIKNDRRIEEAMNDAARPYLEERQRQALDGWQAMRRVTLMESVKVQKAGIEAREKATAAGAGSGR